MKRFLLTPAVMLLLSATAAEATTVTIVMKDYMEETFGAGWGSRNKSNLTELSYLGFTFSTDKGTASQNPMYNKAGDYRVYGGSQMTVTAPDNGEMTSIVFNVSEDGLRRWPEITSSTGEVTFDVAQRTVSWTGTSNTVTFGIGETADNGTQSDKAGIFQFNSVVLNVNSEMPFSSTPEITPVGTKYADKVEITITAAEGAEIYYTIDGSTPVNGESGLYSGPFTLTRNATVKAIAVEEGKEPSNVVEETYEILNGKDILSIIGFLTENPEWNASSNNHDIFTFSGEYTVAYQNGRMLFIEDSTGGLLITGRLNQTYNPGDVITGFRGTFRGINGVPQLVAVASSFEEPVSESQYQYETATYSALTEYYNISRAYVVRDMEYFPDENAESTASFGYFDFAPGERIIVYNGFGSASEFNPNVVLPNKSSRYDIYGILSCAINEGVKELQFIPTKFAVSSAVKDIDNSSSVISREYLDITGRRISSPTDGIVIVVEHNADGTVKTHKEVIR